VLRVGVGSHSFIPPSLERNTAKHPSLSIEKIVRGRQHQSLATGVFKYGVERRNR